MTCDLMIELEASRTGGRIQSLRTRAELDLGQAYHSRPANASLLSYLFGFVSQLQLSIRIPLPVRHSEGLVQVPLAINLLIAEV